MFAEVSDEKAGTDCAQGRLWNSTRQNRQDQRCGRIPYRKRRHRVTPFIARGKRPLVTVARRKFERMRRTTAAVDIAFRSEDCYSGHKTKDLLT